MTQVITQDDMVWAVELSKLQEFIIANSRYTYEDAWDKAASIIEDGSYVLTRGELDAKEYYWVEQFFIAHPFINKVFFYFND